MPVRGSAPKSVAGVSWNCTISESEHRANRVEPKAMNPIVRGDRLRAYLDDSEPSRKLDAQIVEGAAAARAERDVAEPDRTPQYTAQPCGRLLVNQQRCDAIATHALRITRATLSAACHATLRLSQTGERIHSLWQHRRSVRH